MQKGIAVRVRRPPSPEPPPEPESAEPARPPRAQPPLQKPGVYTSRDFARSLVISLVVGTALVLINVRPTPGEGPDLGRILINYLVPFLVASTSAMFANASRLKAVARNP